MPKYLQLQIPTPCHEDWNQMAPEVQGRFCNSCQKTVTDFTQMSDAQLIAFFKKPKQSTCGRFTQEQLENDILIPRKRIPWVRYFFQIALPAFLLSLKSTAQTIRIKTPIEILPAAIKGEIAPIIIGDTTANQLSSITGTVKDSQGIPVPYATVFIKGTTNGVAADSLGIFSINNVLLPCTVSVSCIGFASTEVHVAYNQKKANIQIEVNPQMQYMVVGGAVSVRSITRKKTKKELRKETCIKPIIVAPTLSVYPNPILSSTPLHLKWQNFEAGNYAIEVYSISGALIQSRKLILEKDIKETSLPVNQLAIGNYFVRLINEKTGNQLSQQFIVQE
jgi:hypothetical protein